MRQMWIITKRELKSYFDSLMAYIIIFLFLGITGLLTWAVGFWDIFLVKQASLEMFFKFANITFAIFIPALTMKHFAEETKSGTIELLITKPVTEWQIVVGKFLSTMLLVVIMLVFTLPYYVTVANIGPIDHNSVILGYVGIILVCSVYTSLGILASSLTNNQIVAFLIALAINVVFIVIFWMLAMVTPGFIGQLVDYLDIWTHFNSVAKGLLDSRDLVFFASIVILGLVMSEIIISKNRLVK